MRLNLFIFVSLIFNLNANAQSLVNDSLEGFDYVHFKEHLSGIKDKAERKDYLNKVQRNYLKRKYDLNPKSEVFQKETPQVMSCSNSDFEFGNTSTWSITGDFQLMSGVGLDPFGAFPVVCPGGNFSLRLNDNNTACSGPTPKVNFQSTATKTISLTSLNSLIKVNFAGCLLEFPHPQNAAAFIKIEFFDQFNVSIPTPSFSLCYASPPNNIVATSAVTNSVSSALGPQICSTIGSYQVRSFPWQTQAFNMSPYIGQNIVLKLTANWCLYNYDWAYAYFDVCCDSTCASIASPYVISNAVNNLCLNSTLNTNLCSSTTTNSNYNWYNSTGPIATGSCITVSSAGSYTLQSSSTTNSIAITQEIFNLGLNPTVTFSPSSNYGCSNSSSGISLFVSPSGGVFSGPGISGNIFQPWVVGNGVYNIKYVYTDSIAGCKDSITQTIQVSTCKTTDLAQNFKFLELNVGPNPFVSDIFINCEGIPQEVDFILFNYLGQQLIRKRLFEGKNVIETEGIPQGLYIYSIEQQNIPIKQGKLVKD